jgi:tRNA-2-methylthio-N6-dimethylallyladenosine synthase
MVGRELPVLIDGPSRRRAWEVSGRTEGNTVVNLPGAGSLVGQIHAVRVSGYGPNSLRGELVTVSC